MYNKYSPTMSGKVLAKEKKKWAALLRQKREEQDSFRLWKPRSILKTSEKTMRHISLATTDATTKTDPVLTTKKFKQSHLAPLRELPTRTLTSMQITKRAHAKKQRKRDVIAGVVQATRPIPGPRSLEPFTADFDQAEWHMPFDLNHPDAAQLCIMAWACQGKLFGGHRTPELIRHAIKLMNAKRINILWLNDARFTKGSIDHHIALIHELYPDCRCQQFNQMGGAIAIVNYKWKSYISDTSADPMGMGIINSIDIKIG
jgi:hypothetical protein